MATSPTQLSLRLLRNEGWRVDICERWVPNPGHPGGGKRRDLFGLVDLVALRGHQTMGVQTTTNTNVNNHLTKMLDDDHKPMLADLLVAGWLVVVHGWRLTDRLGHACKHGRDRCGCRWQLHRNITIDVGMLV
jgi:hypothetical protein